MAEKVPVAAPAALIRNWVRTFWEIRFLGLLALLLRGGLPLDRALPQAAQILPEGPCRTCARAMEQAVVAGSSLAGAARQQPLLLSPLAVEFAAWEKKAATCQLF